MQHRFILGPVVPVKLGSITWPPSNTIHTDLGIAVVNLKLRYFRYLSNTNYLNCIETVNTKVCQKRHIEIHFDRACDPIQCKNWASIVAHDLTKGWLLKRTGAKTHLQKTHLCKNAPAKNAPLKKRTCKKRTPQKTHLQKTHLCKNAPTKNAPVQKGTFKNCL